MNALGGPGAGQGAGGEASENGQQQQPGQRSSAANQQQQQLHMAMQNPQQMMQVIQAQIAQLQRQWATVQNQPESAQKAEAMQNLGMNMKRMRLLQAQTSLALQNREQQPQQMPNQNQQQQNEVSQETSQMGQQVAPSTSQVTTSDAIASMPLLQANGTALDASNPAHNAQLAALQAFAQQQRIQAMQHQPRNSLDGQNWQQQQQQQTPVPQPQPTPSNGMSAASPPPQAQQSQQPYQFSVPQSATSSQQSQSIPQQQQQFAQTPKGDLVGAVRAFMAARGTPLPSNMPTSFTGPASAIPGDSKSIDLQTLFATVVQFGGSARVSAQPNGWSIVASRLGLSVAPTPASYTPGQNEVDAKGILLPPFVAPRLSQVFKEIFSAFEEFWLAKMKSTGPQANSATTQQQPQPQPSPNQQPIQISDAQQRPSSSAGQNQSASQQAQQQQQQVPPQMGSQNGSFPQQQQQSPLGVPNATPQMTPQQVAQGMQGGGSVSAQEALQRAQQMQAQLPKQMQQLQDLINGGKMTQQEARDKFTYLQNNAKMAMLQAQAQAQGGAMATGSANVNASMQTPNAMSQMQQGQPQATSQQTSTVQAPTATESKKGSKKGKKSTTTSAKGSANAIAAEVNRDSRTASPTQATMAHLTMQAQQAVRVLQQGNMNLNLQIQAFAAIQTARMATQGVTGVDVSSISHTMAQIYSQYLRNAQEAGQPMHIAAPLAFSAAEAEMQKSSQGQNQNQNQNSTAQTRPSQTSTPKMQAQPLQQSISQQPQSSMQPQQSSLPPFLPQPSSSASTSSSRISLQPSSSSTGAQMNLSGPAQVPLQTPTKPNKFKIEYMPIRREVRSHGGWDLDVVERQMNDLIEGKGRFPRSVRELGHVDIESLIMSLRSRLEVEVTYALNALYILTAGVQATGFHLLLSICEDLCDELLDLLEESAYGRLYRGEDEAAQVEEGKQLTNGHVESQVIPPSHSEWMMDIKEEDEEMDIRQRKKAKRRKSQGDEEEDAARQRQDLRCAQVALSIIDIFYNLATIYDNHIFLNNEPRFIQLLMRITQSVEEEQVEKRNEKAGKKKMISVNGHASAKDYTVFTSTEAMRIRKDVLSIIACLSGESCILTRFDHGTVIAMMTLIFSFIKDASDIEQEYGSIFVEVNGMNGMPIQQQQPKSQAVARRVPQHADMALGAFSSIAQPDVNRQLLAELIEESKWVTFGESLIKLLPISEADFQMLKTEARLGYCERIAMSLFNIAYLGSPHVKAELKRKSGAIGVIFRCIKRLIKVNAFHRNPFAVMTRRLIETLRMLDGGDNFDRPALIGFGMENVSSSSREKKSGNNRVASITKAICNGGLLAQDEISVVELMTVEGIDPVIIAELEQLL